jgi:cell fate regulator YaaT (PSP1 superfamily)
MAEDMGKTPGATPEDVDAREREDAETNESPNADSPQPAGKAEQEAGEASDPAGATGDDETAPPSTADPLAVEPAESDSPAANGSLGAAEEAPATRRDEPDAPPRDENHAGDAHGSQRGNGSRGGSQRGGHGRMQDRTGPPPEIPRIGPPGTTILIRHGRMRAVGQFRHELPAPPPPGAKVVIRTDRGVELGDVVASIAEERSNRCVTPTGLEQYLRACEGAYPLHGGGTVLRLANPQDLIDDRHLQNGAREEATYCRQQIRDLRLNMRIVTVEHTLGGERILFYFTSEQRVDFRELVRRLAAQYRTRIEMRQVGARDEARVAADYERCGQRCCCQQFLKELQPVSMRMAKIQKATLDPSKISGRCGRLMCCLRYEDVTYDELRKKLPRKNIWVRTADKIGRVVDTQIITQLVRLELPDRTMLAVSNDEITERDVPAPQMAPMPEPGERRGPPDRRPPQGAQRGSGPRRWPKAAPVGAPAAQPAEEWPDGAHEGGQSRHGDGSPQGGEGAAEPAIGIVSSGDGPLTGPDAIAAAPDIPISSGHSESPADGGPRGNSGQPGAEQAQTGRDSDRISVGRFDAPPTDEPRAAADSEGDYAPDASDEDEFADGDVDEAGLSEAGAGQPESAGPVHPHAPPGSPHPGGASRHSGQDRRGHRRRRRGRHKRH